ncbi:MAG: ribosome silencing factor [Kiritimatiellales bacterium]|nr:ribosome silencing factor [Kiritimatiellales bacterium]
MKKVTEKKTKAVKKVVKKTVKKVTPEKAPVKKPAKAAPKTAKAAPKAKVDPKAAPKTVKAAPKVATAAPKKPAGLASLPEVVQKAVQFLDARKAENIAVLDLQPLANLSDYFVIATAANAPHLKALGDGLQRLYKNEQYKGFRAAGTGDSGWVIVDYDGVMVHVFSFEMRNLYDLEQLWKSAKRIKL